MRAIFLVIFFLAGVVCFSQKKYPGPVHFIEGYHKIDSLVIAGGPLKYFPVRIPGKDTLTNSEIKFKSALDGIAISETYLVIKNSKIIHFQLNTFDRKNTSVLTTLCTKQLGVPEKVLEGVKSALYFWKSFVNRLEIHTVLITAKGGRKGEFISWVIIP